jgi:hypothetical protein
MSEQGLSQLCHSSSSVACLGWNSNMCKQVESIMGRTFGQCCKMDSAQPTFRLDQSNRGRQRARPITCSKQAIRPIGMCAARIKGYPLAGRVFLSAPPEPSTTTEPEPSHEEERNGGEEGQGRSGQEGGGGHQGVHHQPPQAPPRLVLNLPPSLSPPPCCPWLPPRSDRSCAIAGFCLARM